MSIGNLIKKIQDIMRNDKGVDGDAQRISQLVWMLFLKIYDAKEQEWELYNNYESIIPVDFKWRNWAVDHKDGNALTGEDLLNFVNNKLFIQLKKLNITKETPLKQKIVKFVFEDAINYMKDGVLLRQVINTLNEEVDFEDYRQRHAFGEIYETILKSLQSAGDAGEYYTPRAVTDFMVKVIDPKLGESIADFACGTGGFLTSALNHLEKQIKTTQDKEQYNSTIYGIEKKHLPYILCITNMLLHDVDEPKIFHDNSLEKNVREYKESDKFNIILMNPPYGGSEKDTIKSNFPVELRSSETADLFMNLIMYRLKNNGRAAVILPDGFLFGDNVKAIIKKKLLEEYNLHTIIRMPHSVFAPYTSIATNILFFDKTNPTDNLWVYRMDMPKGYKNFSKTKPMELSHFDDVIEWWNSRKEIQIEGYDKAKKYSLAEIEKSNYNLDLCGFPNKQEEILPPKELIEQYRAKRDNLKDNIERTLLEIEKLIGV